MNRRAILRAVTAVPAIVTLPAMARPHRDQALLLPSGFLSTQGNQIVDQNGNNVRIAALGMMGCLYVNGFPDGLTQAPLQTMIDNIALFGFNAVRIHASFYYLFGSGSRAILGNTRGNNPSLEHCTPIQILDAMIAACKVSGMKVIIDHNSNDTECGQNSSGLWYGDGDGGRTTGTFQANWVALATRYAGNSTVIGFDLHNEPHPVRSQRPLINWAGRANGGLQKVALPGNMNDIHAMYTSVGNAILVANPNVLIICEGILDYSNGAPWGDLRYIIADPVVLNKPGKVVYSIHNYPQDVSGYLPDSGAAAISQWNSVWGFVYEENIAPVWIGEAGASLDGTSQQGESLAAQEAWATTLVSYCNGTAPGGITVAQGKQGISVSWWAFGPSVIGQPNGILNSRDSWSTKSLKSGQQAVWSQLLYRGSARRRL
jgi:endoglucanase